MKKTPVHNTFEGKADLYQNKHAFVSKYGEDLVSLLDPQPSEHILDLGCGTGELATKIAAQGAHVTGVDMSSSMIEMARKTFPHMQFFVMDATNLTVKPLYDAVFSNAVLHWIPQAEAVIQNVRRVLKPHGRFVAEFGGVGNVRHIIDAISQARREAGYSNGTELNPWFFPTIAEYTTLLEAHGFEVSIAQLFDRPTALDGADGMKNWIQMFAADYFFKDIPDSKKESLINRAQELAKPLLYKQEVWYADYRRLRIRAYKIQ